MANRRLLYSCIGAVSTQNRTNGTGQEVRNMGFDTQKVVQVQEVAAISNLKKKNQLSNINADF